MLEAGQSERLGTARVAILKPRGGPLAELSRSLSKALGHNITGETLTHTTYGLVDAVKPLPPGESLLSSSINSKKSSPTAATGSKPTEDRRRTVSSLSSCAPPSRTTSPST